MLLQVVISGHCFEPICAARKGLLREARAQPQANGRHVGIWLDARRLRRIKGPQPLGIHRVVAELRQALRRRTGKHAELFLQHLTPLLVKKHRQGTLQARTARLRRSGVLRILGAEPAKEKICSLDTTDGRAGRRRTVTTPQRHKARSSRRRSVCAKTFPNLSASGRQLGEHRSQRRLCLCVVKLGGTRPVDASGGDRAKEVQHERPSLEARSNERWPSQPSSAPEAETALRNTQHRLIERMRRKVPTKSPINEAAQRRVVVDERLLLQARAVDPQQMRDTRPVRAAAPKCQRSSGVAHLGQSAVKLADLRSALPKKIRTLREVADDRSQDLASGVGLTDLASATDPVREPVVVESGKRRRVPD